MSKRKKEFVVALAVVVIVFALLALPYALTEVYGLKTKLILVVQLVVLTVFSAGMLIWWLVRYRRTSHDLEKFREETERKIRGRNEREHDASEGRNRCGHKRK